MINRSTGFLIGHTSYQEEAGLMHFLTHEGIVTLYDAYLLRRNYAIFRLQPEHLFEISYAPSHLNPENLFLKSWEIKTPACLSPERLCLWQGLLAFTRLVVSSEESPELFKYYLKTFELISQDSIPVEKIYFMLSYILLQIVTMLGVGDFSYHYEKIWRRLKLSEAFHQDFLHHGLLSKDHFDTIVSYVFDLSSQLLQRPEVLSYLRLCLQYPLK